MKMMTKEIEKVLGKYPIYSQDGLMGDAKVVVKFFDPCSKWTWYATEGERREDGDWEFFGLVCGQEWEWGYFCLSQITEARGWMGLPMERDRWLSPGAKTVAEVVRSDYGDCPEHLIKPRAAHIEEVVIDASADALIETETWTSNGSGQQTLF